MTTLVYLNLLFEIDKYYNVIYKDDEKLKLHIIYGMFISFYLVMYFVLVIL